MAKFELTSTCDDAGNMLAARLHDSSFVRVVESHETREAAEKAKQEWMDWYKSRRIAIGEGCLSVREVVRPIWCDAEHGLDEAVRAVVDPTITGIIRTVKHGGCEYSEDELKSA